MRSDSLKEEVTVFTLIVSELRARFLEQEN